jgi:hypothetical protein
MDGPAISVIATYMDGPAISVTATRMPGPAISVTATDSSAVITSSFPMAMASPGVVTMFVTTVTNTSPVMIVMFGISIMMMPMPGSSPVIMMIVTVVPVAEISPIGIPIEIPHWVLHVSRIVIVLCRHSHIVISKRLDIRNNIIEKQPV